MSQILDAIKGYITPELIALGANKLGETNNGIGKTIGALIPVILGGLADKSQDKTAFNSIFNLISNPNNAKFLDNLGGLIGGGNLAHGDPKDVSGRLMSMLFGNKVGGIIDSVASHAGVNRKSSSSLLGMVGPLIMGYLSKRIAKDGLGATALASLLGTQRNSIRSAIPGALASSLGFANVKEEVRETATASTGGGSSLMKWLLPLLLLAGLAYLVYNMGGCGAQIDSTADKIGDTASEMADKAGDAITNAADKAGDAITDAGDAIGDAVNNLGEFFSRTMACGVELSIPQNGVENKVIAFIEDDSKAVDKETWFNFDRLVFATGKADLDMSKSEEQLKNIAEILKCYPKTKFKIGGYTDNTGSKEVNMKLSQGRANTVTNALVGLGIDKGRLDAEGYGDQHPVASNATEEGRAKNRRIALRVTAK